MSDRPAESQQSAPRVVLLHADDNVLISVRPLAAGEEFDFEGRHYCLSQAVPIGHKLARTDLNSGEKILRYGAPIGSLFVAAKAGDWVHMHNLKSDYLASHTRKGRAGEDQNNGH